MAKKQQKRSSSALSLFDAVSQLDEQDSRADVKRRRTAHSQIEKARQVQTQTKIYHSLMETRILLQRAVVATTDSAKPSPGSSSSEQNDDDVQNSCDALLTKLLETRRRLTATDRKNSDGKPYDGIIQNENENDHEEDDSSVDDDEDKVSQSELQTTLQNEYDECREEWKTVLDRRHKDLKLQSGGLTAKMMSKQQNSSSSGGGGAFQVMDASFWQQVESVREYEDLRRRQHQQQQDEEESETAPTTSILELFDDSKVYQQLLKDFVSQSTSAAASNNPSGNGTLQHSTTRSRNDKHNKTKNKGNKKKVDRRASKGRKLRFNEIPKLVNFTFPLSRGSGSGSGSGTSTTNFLNQDEYFQSLFGGSVSK
mmetsp:Transcript_1174/g.2564  ORF Transcript_1174/g.2564 Transcript_1174/m.2564 type:complete len:368 (-) Transcript_1174:35-1138(-)